MVKRRILLVLLAIIAMITSGCTSDEQLPDAAELLRESADATSKITSTHFTLAVNGEVPGLSVRNIDGDLTTAGGPEGAAKGTATLTLGGQLIEGEFVLVDQTLYLKGPTGGFQQIPAAMIAGVYDPSAVLDPERGIAKLLAGVRDAKTEATEDVAGTPTYRVTGAVSKDVIATLLPGITSDVNMTLWLAQEGEHLPVKASAALPTDGEQPASVDVTLSDVDKPVTVTAP
ncbi:MAG: LppX_LprAFG lipoprotein [Haloechinothrix sp.]